jgi:hypothetical protein
MSESDVNKQLVQRLIWLFVTVFIAWPLAWFAAPVWVFLLPLEAVLEPIKGVTNFLEKVITWPRLMGQAVMDGRTDFPSPLD